MYVHTPHACLVPLSERGAGFLGTGITDGCKFHLGAGNQTWVLWKSSQWVLLIADWAFSSALHKNICKSNPPHLQVSCGFLRLGFMSLQSVDFSYKAQEFPLRLFSDQLMMDRIFFKCLRPKAISQTFLPSFIGCVFGTQLSSFWLCLSHRGSVSSCTSCCDLCALPTHLQPALAVPTHCSR